MFGDIPDGLRVRLIGAKVNICDIEAHEKCFPHAIFCGWSEGDVETCKGSGEHDFVAFEVDISVVPDAADVLVTVVFWLGQGAREADLTGGVAAGWYV